MILSDEFISELKARNDIGEIVGEYVNLQRKGKNLMGICPFHSERTPSFCVYPHNGSFYCFGCGAGGDVITFLRLTEHYDYIEAVKVLSERAGMNFEVSEEDSAVHSKKLLIYKINREAAKFYHNALFSSAGSKALEYFKNRGISTLTMKYFGLGYSPASGYSLVDYLKKSGYNGEDIILSNLAFKNRNLKEIDRFRDRLMFPIIDVRGNVIAFGARTLGNETPKYINTSDTLVFKKSMNLFALNFAKKSGESKLILTEGYMDVVALHQEGFTNAVAGLGTALTSNQVKLIARHSDEVFISYDSDEAGQKAANRAIEMLKGGGVNVKVITIPKAKDPDEFIRSQGKDGGIKFKNLIENSKNDIEYRLSRIKSECNLDFSDGKIKYLTEASKILANCQNSIEREVYAIKLGAEIGVSKSSVLLQTEKYLKQKLKLHKKKEFKNIEKITSGVNDKVNPDKHSNLRAAAAEESLISCIINNPDIANTIFSKISLDNMITSFNKRILTSIKDIVSKGKMLDITNIAAYGFTFEEIGRITKMICSYTPIMITDEAICEYLSVLSEENKKNKFKNIEHVPEQEVMKYIEDLKTVKK